ncbi:MAG TPA: CocE/NonD family hydrolase [Dermatophilaceae bacterium]
MPAIHGSPSRLDDQGHPQSCVIEADLYKPHAASATNRVPTILTTNGFGGSYGGQIQFATAAADPRVVTLVPLITWNDLRYSLAPNNTASTAGVTYANETPGSEKIGWSSLFFGVGIADGVQGAGIDPAREVGCPNFVLQACEAKATLDTLGYPSAQTYALTDRVSAGHYLDRVTVPTFLIQGQNDTLLNLQEAVATYQGLKAHHVPVSMAWQSWGHSGGMKGNTGAAPGELDLTGAHIEDTYLGLRIKNWFDHYLKGVTTAPTGPEFSFFRDWVDYTGTATPAYGTASSYPVGTPRSYYLSGAGDLVSAPAAVRPGSVSWSNPGLGAFGSYSEVSGLEGQIPPGSLPANTTTPYDAPGTLGAWTTQALTSDTSIVGVPTLDVTFTSTAVAAAQPAGHRLRLVLASTDAAYKNAYAVQPVTVTANPLAPAVLRIPVVR